MAYLLPPVPQKSTPGIGQDAGEIRGNINTTSQMNLNVITYFATNNRADGGANAQSVQNQRPQDSNNVQNIEPISDIRNNRSTNRQNILVIGPERHPNPFLRVNHSQNGGFNRNPSAQRLLRRLTERHAQRDESYCAARISRQTAAERQVTAMLRNLNNSDDTDTNTGNRRQLSLHMNLVPEFDPIKRHQTINNWIDKVEECAVIYGWEEAQIIHFALNKLSGRAKDWYESHSSLLYNWSNWKEKLIRAFPSKKDYTELLTEMLDLKVAVGGSLVKYLYEKSALLQLCNITGTNAVDCLLQGIEDANLRMSARAANFSTPEEVIQHFQLLGNDQGPSTSRR